MSTTMNRTEAATTWSELSDIWYDDEAIPDEWVSLFASARGLLGQIVYREPPASRVLLRR